MDGRIRITVELDNETGDLLNKMLDWFTTQHEPKGISEIVRKSLRFYEKFDRYKSCDTQ